MIGEIPAGWSIKTVADICDKPQYGLTASANSSSDVGPKFLRITDITQSGVNWDKVPYCECQIDQIDKFRLFNNDILFARIGGTTGKSFIVKNPPQSVFASYLIRLRVLSEKDNPNYLYFYFQSPFYWQQINANKDNNLKGGVNASVLSKLQIISPPMNEQQKIAAVLAKIHKAIAVQESIIEAAQELKKSTMQHVFTYGLRGEKTKETEVGRVPESWEIKRFGEFATLHRGYDLPVQNRKEGKFPIVGSNGICGCHNKSKIKGPGVVTGRSGSIGISYYIDDDYWPLNTGLYVENFHNNDPLYSHYFFQSFNFKKYASGVSVPTLNRNLVHAAVIGVPLIKDQNDIVSVFKTIDDKIEIHSTIKSALQDIFKTMLNKLMTGEVRV